MQEENNQLKKQLEKLETAQIAALRDDLKGKAETISGMSFIGQVVDAPSADALKKLAFDLKIVVPNAAITLVGNVAGKASVVVAFDDNLVKEKGYDASALIKTIIAPLIKGGGGGQKSLATAGGQDVTNLAAVIQAVKATL